MHFAVYIDVLGAMCEALGRHTSSVASRDCAAAIGVTADLLAARAKWATRLMPSHEQHAMADIAQEGPMPSLSSLATPHRPTTAHAPIQHSVRLRDGLGPAVQEACGAATRAALRLLNTTTTSTAAGVAGSLTASVTTPRTPAAVHALSCAASRANSFGDAAQERRSLGTVATPRNDDAQWPHAGLNDEQEDLTGSSQIEPKAAFADCDGDDTPPVETNCTPGRMSATDHYHQSASSAAAATATAAAALVTPSAGPALLSVAMTAGGGRVRFKSGGAQATTAVPTSCLRVRAVKRHRDAMATFAAGDHDEHELDAAPVTKGLLSFAAAAADGTLVGLTLLDGHATSETAAWRASAFDARRSALRTIAQSRELRGETWESAAALIHVTGCAETGRALESTRRSIVEGSIALGQTIIPVRTDGKLVTPAETSVEDAHTISNCSALLVLPLPDSPTDMALVRARPMYLPPWMRYPLMQTPPRSEASAMHAAGQHRGAPTLAVVMKHAVTLGPVDAAPIATQAGVPIVEAERPGPAVPAYRAFLGELRISAAVGPEDPSAVAAPPLRAVLGATTAQEHVLPSIRASSRRLAALKLAH